MSEEYSHCDKLGNPVVVGDCVAYPQSNALCIGTVIKINPKMIKVSPVGVKGYWSRGVNKYPEDLVKLDSQEVSLYILKNVK